MGKSYEAWNRFGLLRTFSDLYLAERYRDNMATLGAVITLKVVRMDRRRMAS